MFKSRALKRRHVLLGTAGALFAPAIARAAQRGVSDTEILVGSMADLSGVTAVQGVNNADAMRMAYDEINAKGGIRPQVHASWGRQLPSPKLCRP